jgi:hypothetical protein
VIPTMTCHPEQPNSRCELGPEMNVVGLGLCWIRMRYVEAGRLRIGAL